VLLEIPRQLAGGREREAELAGELADRPLALRADLREHGHVPATERRVAAHEVEQLGSRTPARPQSAHHPSQQCAQLAQLVRLGYHRVTIILSEAREEVNLPMCGSHGHRWGRRGFPDREQLVDRLQRYQEHLEHEQQKVKELLDRLADAPQQTAQV
jgi:hypothetical protein